MSGDFTFLKGNIETIILCALYNKDMYGYEIARSIKERSGNKYEIKQPTLYSYLKRLEQDGYIYSYWGGESNGGRRRYYKLTEKGRESCEKFIAEWEYQRTVMGSLVDGTADVEEMSQDQATSLFGRKTPRKRKTKTFDEQDEITRRLNEIAPLPEEEPTQEPEQEVVSQSTIEQSTAPQVENQSVEQSVTTQAVEISQPAEPTVIQQENPTDKFAVNQDDADTFMQNFDNLAMEASQKQDPSENIQTGENYQHRLLNIIGDQLDEANQELVETQSTSTMAINASAELEEVADNLAREGIRMRIYNHATANFKSKTLIPHPKVICQSAWLTYAVAFILFGILILTNIATKNWLAPLITIGVLLIAPVTATVYATANQIRTEKPKFVYKTVLTIAIAICLIVTLTSLAISLFNNIELSKFADVTNKILIPMVVSGIPSIFVVVYNYFYKKY